MKRAAFLDRDGVLIEEVHHLHRPAQVRLISGAAAAVRELRRLGFLAIVVTNQSVVARGLCTEAELVEIHAELDRQLAAQGTQLDDLFYCSHHPTEGVGRLRVDCACRKPRPGMLHAARERHGLNLGRSVVIGDKVSDLETGRAAGCRAILVRTGHGMAEETAARQIFPALEVAADLASAVALLGRVSAR